MSTTYNKINRLFNNSLFKLLVQAPQRTSSKSSAANTSSANSTNSTTNESSTSDHSPNSLVTYLNPIHPYYIHVVERNESIYLDSLSSTEQTQLITQLSEKQTSHIVFQNKQQIPTTFLQQNKISIAVQTDSNFSLFQYLHNAVRHIPIEECTMHGSMVVIDGKGILITGDSGTGKSSLLLTLLERGHLWVADDAPLIYRTHSGQVYVTNAGHLTEYLHIKAIGAINADQTFGKAKRIPRHRLAGIIHLSDNVASKKTVDCIFNTDQNETILGQVTPKWRVLNSSNQTNIAALAETIAKQLILNNESDNASQALISDHDSVVSIDNTKEVQ